MHLLFDSAKFSFWVRFSISLQPNINSITMKYPIGIQSFDQIINNGYVYVDKTELIYSLVTEGKIYFLGRPRRFGKSLLVSTLEHYFLGHKDLFKGLKIDSLEQEWLEYPVFHIDFNGSDFMKAGTLEEVLEGTVSAWERKYGKSPDFTDVGKRFVYVLKCAHEKTGHRCVVLIDEYDKPMLDVLDSGRETTVDGNRIPLEERNREVLRAFYSVFKAADADLQFVLLTGVTKFSQITVFSGFNQPKDISMDERYDTLCGITQEELEHYFADSIAELAVKFRQSISEMKELLKARYDGYHFSTRMVDVYNPFSLLNVFDSMRMADYWFKSGTPTYLVRLLARTRENLDELTGRYYREEMFVDYKATAEKPLPMIYQSGYLTIKDYNMRRNTFLLDFPNDEVKEGFLTVIASDYLKPKSDINNSVMDMTDALEAGDLETFRKLLTSFLASIPYSMRRKNDEVERERYFQYTFYLILRLMSIYTVYTEKEQSQGRLDCIVETDKYVYIFEFKLDGTAEAALKQIEEKGYARPYEVDARKLYRIGVNFSSETGTLDDWQVIG